MVSFGLRTFADHRTYFADVNATVVDLIGLGAVRASLPHANGLARSLVQKDGWISEPITLLSTGTAVWYEDNARYGVMFGERLLTGAPGGPWSCFDAARDPGQVEPLPPEKCGRLMQNAIETFPK